MAVAEREKDLLPVWDLGGLYSAPDGPDVARDLETADAEARAIAERAQQRIADSPIPVELSNASAEAIPVDDDTFDTVVSTWTLCSVPNVYRALAELRRVLKRGGQLIFVEHGASPEPSIHRWQKRIEPMWKLIGGGCHLSRSADVLIANAGFRIGELETGYVPGPKIATFTYRGVATPR